MPRKKKPWTFSAGSRGCTVKVFERRSGGILYMSVWNSKKGRAAKRSLGHRDKDLAIRQAQEEAEKRRQGIEAFNQALTLETLLNLYVAEHEPLRKSYNLRVTDQRRAEMWATFVGLNADPRTLSIKQLKTFANLRSKGVINGRGVEVPAAEREPTRKTAVYNDLKWLMTVFRWATRYRRPDGTFLLNSNPWERLGKEISKWREPTPRQAVASDHWYQAILSVADQVKVRRTAAGPRRSLAVSRLKYLPDSL